MRYALYAPNFGDFADPANLLGLARDAEDAGWDGLFLWDHIVLMPGVPLIDAWVALSAIAAEWLDDQRGSFGDMRARARAGPPLAH
jgi:hypothetical protein